MKIKPGELRLYAVTDRAWAHDADGVMEQVRAAIKGGATFVQLREKELDPRSFLSEARWVVGLCHRLGVRCVINDNVDVALLSGADGVHVGQEDMACARARALLGEGRIIGVSAHNVEEALAAEAAGADYLGSGAAFPTGTKDVRGHFVTPEGFAANPEMVLDFYNQRRRELLNTRPNAGHLGLAALEKDFDVRVITQNIDNLHERAGSSQVIHLHGELMKACSVRDLNTTYDLSPERPDIHLGDKDPHGDQLRPFVVWFGEPVPMIEPAIRWVEDCDIFVIIGTSLNVYPAAGLLNYVRRCQPIFLIDPKEVQTYRTDIEHIQRGASEGVRELTELLQSYR